MHLIMETCANKINLFQSVYILINTRSTQYYVTCQASLTVYTNNGGMNRQSSVCQKTIDRNIYRCQDVQADGAFANLISFVVESELKTSLLLTVSSQTTNCTFMMHLHSPEASETVRTGRNIDLTAVLSET